MFSFTYFDFDRAHDIADLVRECGATIEIFEYEDSDECEATVITSDREQLLNFIEKYEYFTSGQYPSALELDEIAGEIEEIVEL